LQNADVWGFITIYIALLRIKDNSLYKFSNLLKNIILKHLLKDSYKPINVSELSRDLKSLNEHLNEKKLNKEKLFSISGLPSTPESSFKNKSTVTISFDKVSNKKVAPEKKSASVAKKSASVAKKSASVAKKSASVTKKKRAKRCPNGTRRNKKTGNCETYTKK